MGFNYFYDCWGGSLLDMISGDDSYYNNENSTTTIVNTTYNIVNNIIINTMVRPISFC